MDIFNQALIDYLESLKKYPLDEITEHTFRPELLVLFKKFASFCTTQIDIMHEPRRQQGFGAPDFRIYSLEGAIGYIENKKIGENLSKTLKSEQIRKYKRLSPNILLTNYIEWVWIRSDDEPKSARLCELYELESKKFRPTSENLKEVAGLIKSFFSIPPTGVSDGKTLAKALAIRARNLKDFLEEELERQKILFEVENKANKLLGLMDAFKSEIFHGITIAEFADAFAQTLVYGLFLARLNAEEERVNLSNAEDFIPSSFSLIAELVGFLKELKKHEYRSTKWIVEETLLTLNSLDLALLQKNMSFGGGKIDLDGLEVKDPYIYFYEDFLAAYDPALRETRGVYYTPPAVVGFIVRSVNEIIKDIFQIPGGYGDRNAVTVLDFATGTGAFLLEAMRTALEQLPKDSGKRKLLIREHLLKNFFGFEYLVAPYTVAHLKLSQWLKETGYEMQTSGNKIDRLQIYLTNTLEDGVASKANLFLSALSDEIQASNYIKNKPVLVIIGNPPYSGHSKNNGEWIKKLVDDYKRINGEDLKERNSKWLQDDYVKFIRFAEWKMKNVEQGVIGIITNHSFLDNPTFRGMRYSLMASFDQIYILDLHGNAKKKETNTDGTIDQNVFDIQQGVCISFLIKSKGLTKSVKHAHLFGSRKSKYTFCDTHTMKNIHFTELQPLAPFYLFIPQDISHRDEYYQGWSVQDIFVQKNVGIVTARDHFSIHFNLIEIKAVIEDFVNLNIEIARQNYQLGNDVRDWSVKGAQEDIRRRKIDNEKFIIISYRPFDSRYTYYTGKSKGFHCRPRVEIMSHFLQGDNFGLVTVRQVKSGATWQHILVSNAIVESTFISNRTAEINYVYPLYLYPDLTKKELFDGSFRKENFSEDFRRYINGLYDKIYSPEEIMGYIYGVLHSRTFRDKYAPFLRIDFPRIPFVKEQQEFERISILGRELIDIHLLKITTLDNTCQFKGEGSNEVTKLDFQKMNSRVYINESQYFTPVSSDIFQFKIGSYQPAEKFLKDRKSRILTLHEIERYERIIQSLGRTIEIMNNLG